MDITKFLSFEAISLTSTVFFNLTLFIIILAKKNKIPNIFYFLGFQFFVIFWVATTMLFYVVEGETLKFVTHLIYFGPPFIPMFMIMFTNTFPNEKLNYSKLKMTIFLTIPAIVSILAIIPGAVVRDVIMVNGLNTITYGLFYPLYFIHVSTYFLIGLIAMARKYLTLHGKERSQIELIFLSLYIGTFVGVFASLVLPSVGNFTLFWVGSFYAGYFVVAIVYGVVRYGLFDIKLVATEFITLATWIILFVKIIFDTSMASRLVDSGVLILIIISGIMIIRAVMKETALREKDDQLVNNITGLNQQLERTNVKLQELDKKKSEFMSLATHQLRAPLTAMKGYSSMILDGTFGEINNPDVEDAIEKIARSTTDLTMIVEDYLNISRIEQGRMQYNFSTFDVATLIRHIINEMSPTITRAGLIVNLNHDGETKFMVNADDGKIKQVLLNVIDNAIKYTPKGRIDIYLTRTENQKVLIKIEDTGVGIKSEVLPTLFHKYVRAPDASQINILGTGLGLYVAGEILKAHNGRAWGESDGEGKGSRFFIELPLAN